VRALKPAKVQQQDRISRKSKLPTNKTGNKSTLNRTVLLQLRVYDAFGRQVVEHELRMCPSRIDYILLVLVADLHLGERQGFASLQHFNVRYQLRSGWSRLYGGEDIEYTAIHCPYLQ